MTVEQICTFVTDQVLFFNVELIGCMLLIVGVAFVMYKKIEEQNKTISNLKKSLDRVYSELERKDYI